MLINVADVRFALGISQRDFAKILGINRTHLIFLERQDTEIEINDKLLYELGYLTKEKNKEEDKEQVVAQEIVATKTSYSQELKMILFVNQFLDDNQYSIECVVTEDSMFYMPRKIVGRRIKEAREKKGIDVKEIISFIPMTETMYWNHESGRTRLYPVKVKNLAKLLDLPEIVLNERLISLEQTLLIKEIRNRTQ